MLSGRSTFGGKRRENRSTNARRRFLVDRNETLLDEELRFAWRDTAGFDEVDNLVGEARQFVANLLRNGKIRLASSAEKALLFVASKRLPILVVFESRVRFKKRGADGLFKANRLESRQLEASVRRPTFVDRVCRFARRFASDDFRQPLDAVLRRRRVNDALKVIVTLRRGDFRRVGQERRNFSQRGVDLAYRRIAAILRRLRPMRISGGKRGASGVVETGDLPTSCDQRGEPFAVKRGAFSVRNVEEFFERRGVDRRAVRRRFDVRDRRVGERSTQFEDAGQNDRFARFFRFEQFLKKRETLRRVANALTNVVEVSVEITRSCRTRKIGGVD